MLRRSEAEAPPPAGGSAQSHASTAVDALLKPEPFSDETIDLSNILEGGTALRQLKTRVTTAKYTPYIDYRD